MHVDFLSRVFILLMALWDWHFHGLGKHPQVSLGAPALASADNGTAPSPLFLPQTQGGLTMAVWHLTFPYPVATAPSPRVAYNA